MKKASSKSESLSFQRVWRLFKETDRKFQETDRKFQETDRKFQETDRKFQETDRKFQETDRKFQETERQMKETDRKLRLLEELFSGQWGKLVEALVEGELIRILRDRGLEVTRVSSRQVQILDDKVYEIDLLAKNGDEVVVVEVKTTLGKRDIDRFVEKLRIFTRAFPEFVGYKVYGAVAFIRSTHEYTQYAYRRGLFVIRAVGENARIMNDRNFKPYNYNESA